jgi:hypothetical protein
VLEIVEASELDFVIDIEFVFEVVGERLGGVLDKVSELETLVVITSVPVIEGWTLQW